MVDLETFKRLELILDNLLNHEPEPEDTLIAESTELKQLIAQVRAVATPMPDWKRVICSSTPSLTRRTSLVANCAHC